MLKQERAVKPPTGQSHATMRKLRGDAGAGSQEWPDAVGVEQDPMAVVPEENPLDDDVIVDNGTCVVKQEDMEEYQDMGNQPGPAPLPTAPNSTELTAGRIHPPKKSGKKQDLTEEAKAKKEAKAKAIEDAKAAKEAKAAAAKEAKAKAREEAKTEKQAQAKAKAEAREKAKAEAKAMKEAKEKAKEEARAKAKEEAKAKQEAKAKAREHAKAKKEAKSSSTPRKTKPNADKPEVSNGAGSSTGTQAALTATSSTTATLPDDPLITFSGMDLRGVLQQMLDALPVDVAPDGDDPLTSTSSTPTAKSSKSTKEACLPSEPADLTSSDSSALTNSEYLQKILEEFSGLPFIQPTNTEEEDDASEVAAMELINRHFEAAEGDDVLDSESLFMTPITTKKVCVDAFGVAAQEQMDVHVDASESVGIQTSGLLSMPPTITEEECVDAFGVAAQELIDVRVEASEGVGILGSGLLSMPPTITEEECYTSGDAAQELMEVHVEASEDVGIQTSGLLSMPPTITELPPTITEKECHASEVSAQELMDVHVEASEDVGIQTSGLLSMPSTINEKECVDASEVAAQELMDVHVGASEGVGIQGSGLLPMPSTITESEFYETGDIADSIMDSLISEGAGLPGSGSYPVESQVVTMVDESSSGVPMGCVMIRDTSPGTETLDSESMLLENESQGSAPARVVITGIKMAETCLESSEAMELDVDQERKRKTAKDSGESFKRHCPNPEDVDVGSFTAFFITDQRQPAPEFLKTLMELRLVETVESREVKRMRYITHLQEHRRSDIWCVELTTSGALTQKLNGILAQSNQMQELDTLNATFEPSKRIHLAKQMTQSDMALTSYLLVLQKILGTSCKVDSKMLLVEFGRTITISGCFEEYPEQATKAYQLMNRYARNQVDSVLSTETKKTVDDSVGADTLEKLREALAKLNGVEGAECVSLLKRHLTEDVFEIFKNRKTQCVKDFLECISAGLKNLNTPIGVYAVVPDAYFRFSLFFDRIISDIHGFGPGEKHPPSDLGDGSHFPPLDIEGKYILSTRIRCARSVKGFSFIPSLSKDQLHSMEGKFRKAFKENFNKEMAGKYYPLTSNIPSCAKEIFDKHLFRNDRNSNLENAGAKCHWPTGRGVFINTQRTFIAYTNVEDNIKLVATENGSDVGNALGRINQGLSALGKEMRFTWNQRLGWLTFDPANLGSTVRASVQIRLPKLAAQDDFLDICKTLHLRANREEGDENIYTLSNKKCLGITERDAVSQMYTGVQQLIQMERATD